jgi:hypothetical protein
MGHGAPLFFSLLIFTNLRVLSGRPDAGAFPVVGIARRLPRGRPQVFRNGPNGKMTAFCSTCIALRVDAQRSGTSAATADGRLELRLKLLLENNLCINLAVGHPMPAARWDSAASSRSNSRSTRGYCRKIPAPGDFRRGAAPLAGCLA